MLIGFLDEKLIKIEKHHYHNGVEILIIPDCPWSARTIRILRILQVGHKIKVI